jgi:rRNA maturation endonuclease Nob1
MIRPKRVLYRGVSMIEGWPEKIAAAQNILSYTLNGQSMARIRYGDEQEDWNADRVACHDCRVVKGEFHVPSCDVEECPVCGGQLLSCHCAFDERGGTLDWFKA